MPARRSNAAAAAASGVDGDLEMTDAATNGQSSALKGETSTTQQNSTVQQTEGDDEFFIGDEDPDAFKIRILPGDSDTAASFEFLNEDHTLGNALRYVIMKNPDVEFCGYAIPHPSDPKMNLRIQTYEDSSVTVHQVLEKGLNDLMDLCDVVLGKFEEAVAEHGRD